MYDIGTIVRFEVEKSDIGFFCHECHIDPMYPNNYYTYGKIIGHELTNYIYTIDNLENTGEQLVAYRICLYNFDKLEFDEKDNNSITSIAENFEKDLIKMSTFNFLSYIDHIKKFTNFNKFKKGDIIKLSVSYVEERLRRFNHDIIPTNVICIDNPLHMYIKGRIIECHESFNNTADILLLDWDGKVWKKLYNVSYGNISFFNKHNERDSKMKSNINVACLEYSSDGSYSLANFKIEGFADFDLLKKIQDDHHYLEKCVNQYNEKESCKSDEDHFSTTIDRVIFNDPATIILWKSWHWEKKVDDSVYPPTVTTYKVQDKTIVKCSPGEEFNKYNGFCAAVAKRVYETNSNIHRIIENADYQFPVHPKEKKHKKPIKKAMKKMEKELMKK